MLWVKVGKTGAAAVAKPVQGSTLALALPQGGIATFTRPFRPTAYCPRPLLATASLGSTIRRMIFHRRAAAAAVMLRGGGHHIVSGHVSGL